MNGTDTLGQSVLDHWEIEKGKLPQDIEGRLKRLGSAVETVENPHEIWTQKSQRIYLQKFVKDTGGYIGCLVTVTDDNKAKTYFLQSLTALDKSRKGIEKLYGES